MKNQAELFSIFQKFYTEIQTQFNISIHVLRSDNIKEYFSAPFTSFMSQHGILHQSSCAHTPQQNGVVERKNRHLVLSLSIVMFLFVFGGTLFLQHVIWLIVCPHLYYTIRFLIPFFSLTNHFMSFLVMFFVVLALFIFSLLDRTNFLSEPQHASSWDILNFKRVIVVIPLKLIATFSPLMSLSLRTHHSSPPLSLFLFLKSYPFPLSPHLMQCLLAHFRFIIAVIMSLFLLLWPRYLLTHFLSLRLLLSRLCLLLLTYPLLFGKVIDLLVILIPFTIFWVTIDYLHLILHLFMLYQW